MALLNWALLDESDATYTTHEVTQFVKRTYAKIAHTHTSAYTFYKMLTDTQIY